MLKQFMLHAFLKLDFFLYELQCFDNLLSAFSCGQRPTKQLAASFAASMTVREQSMQTIL